MHACIPRIILRKDEIAKGKARVADDLIVVEMDHSSKVGQKMNC
jgi:hypothetical protein